MSIGKHIKEHKILKTPQVDANGNITAQVNHRTGLLASLLGLPGGDGEISVATDTRALVRHNGVINGAVAFYPSPYKAIATFKHEAQNFTGTAADVVLTIDPRGSSQYPADFGGIILDDVSNDFTGVASNSGIEVQIAFTANLPTTARWKFTLQQETAPNSGFWVPIGTMPVTYLAGQGVSGGNTIVLRRETPVSQADTKAMRIVVSHNDGTNVVSLGAGVVQVRMLA